MQEGPPQINWSKMPVAANVGGVIFAAGTVVLLLLGVPLARYLLPLAAVAGCGIALILRLSRHETPSNTRILTARK